MIGDRARQRTPPEFKRDGTDAMPSRCCARPIQCSASLRREVTD